MSKNVSTDLFLGFLIYSNDNMVFKSATYYFHFLKLVIKLYTVHKLIKSL